MAILVTGFGPFPGVKQNPSGDVLALLKSRVATVLLPVEYELGVNLLAARLATEQPDVVLLLGLAEGENALRLETFAHNRDESLSADNVGRVRSGVPILLGAPRSYPSTLPLDRLAIALADRGFPVTMSTYAGGYVCNHIFFHAMHLITEGKLQTQCGLVHVPQIDNQTRWTLERLAEAVRCCVEVAAAAS